MKHLIHSILLSLLCCLCASNGLRAEVKLLVTSGIEDATIKNAIQDNATLLLTAFEESVFEGKRPKAKLKDAQLSSELLKTIDELWKSSAMSCPIGEVRQKVTMLKDNGTKTVRGYEVRDIPITLWAADEDDQDQELVLNFDPHGKLIDISLALDKQNYMRVLRDDVTEEDLARRQVVLDFVENFRTAYNRKDIDYLNQLYSDDALIITGKVVKAKPSKMTDGLTKNLGAEKIEYQRMSKTEYITNLKRIFKNNKCINLRFEDITVNKHARRDRIYGVQLKQYWGSDHYNDVGYLFLMINFEDDELHPTIEVRTWQPDKINGKDLQRDEVISLNSFRI